MALKTVFSLKDSVAGILSGIDLGNVDNLNGSLERAARIQIQKADIPEASGIQNIVLYSGVFDYLCDPRIFGTEVKDIRPQGVNRWPGDYVYKKPSEQFDRTKNFLPNGTMTTFEYYNGIPIIRIVSKTPLPKIVIDTMSATSGWTAAGTASGLTQDSAVFYQQPSSLRFTLGVGTGTLIKTLTNSLSLSSYQGVGVAFLAIRIPDNATAADLTSITLNLGSSSANYASVSSTQGFLGAWLSGNWLLVAFDQSLAVNTGTPNWSAINYVQVSLASTQSMVNFRVGGLWIAQPSPNQTYYQSAAIFVPSGSQTAQTTITANTDTIVLNDPAYAIYEYECALSVLQQTGGGLGDATSSQIESILNGARSRTGQVITLGLYDLYRGKNPTESLSSVGNYYDEGNGYGY